MTSEERSKTSTQGPNALTPGNSRLGQLCMALLGDQAEAEAALRESAERAREASASNERSAVFGAARAECAQRLERRPSSAPMDARPAGETPVAARGRALLEEAYPTERDALALRVVAELDWAEVALATGTDEATAKRRASSGLSRMTKLGHGTSDVEGSDACTRARSELLAVLEGSAPESVHSHFAECDACRDHRHAAKRSLDVVRRAGSDFEIAEPPRASAVPPPAAKRSARVSRGWVVAGALGVAAAFALLQRGPEEPSREVPLAGPRVEVVSSTTAQSGLAACAPSGSPCQMLESGARVPSGSRLRTDFGTRATLAFEDGSRVSMERGGELVLRASGPPELLRGRFVVELAGTGTRVLDLPHGSVSAQRAKLSIQSNPEDASIEVVRGSVQVRDRAGGEVALRAGEQTRLGQGPLVALAVPELGESSSWSERLRSDREEQSTPRGLGELAAKKPGAQQELEGAVRLALHRVKTRITGPVARTEVEEVFTNTTDDVLEGIYRFPLPPDAKIERLALEVDGKLMEGAFVERDRAAAIWRGAIVNTAPAAKALMREDIVWVPGPWKDPALLEWQRGGRFELRIFPIPKRGSRRIVLAYTEHVRPAGDTRRYTYPLPHDPSGSTRIDRFELDLQVRGHDPSAPVRATGYDLASGKQGDANTLTLTREDFGPTGDLSIEYSLADRRAELSAFAYDTGQSSGAAWNSSAAEPYVALAIRPKLPRPNESVPRDFAIVVDSSRSMFGESFERAKRVAARLVREMDPDDRVIVLACDSDCRVAPKGLTRPGPDAEREVQRFLDELSADGASDLARAQALAYQALPQDSEREGRIVFIGDGAPTMGPLRADHIEASVARALPLARVRVTALAVGAESDMESLSAAARGGGGVALPYVAGQTVSEAALAVLGAAYGRVLRNVRVTLPEGFVAVAPSRLDAVPAGGELLVAARLRGTDPEGTVTLTGEVAGRPFEQRYALRLSRGAAAGNAFVPRLYASLRIADLERDGSAEARRTALELSSQFNVQSRYTSLLVLETQAMFKAFGLVNQRTAPEWSGEEDVEASSSEGELAFEDAAQSSPLESGAALGSGRAGSRAPAAPAAASRRALPAKPSPADDAGNWDSSEAKKKREVAPGWPLALREEEPAPQRMIPMRRIWERVGEVTTSRSVPKKAGADLLAKAEQEARLDENRRDLTRKLHGLLAAASELERAAQVLTRWLERDPLDPDALTARADLAARRGNRSEAIRLLGSVVDARPGDVSAQRRLERLHRWAGRPEIGCRHLVAAAELRTTDAPLLADAVRCSRATAEPESANRLLASASVELRRKADALLAATAADDSELRGDLKLDANWSGDMDLDLSLVDTEGSRVSWLGAPTRAVIMARDVVSPLRESLALRGAKPGEYVIEIVRANGDGPARGELTVTVAGTSRKIPFSLSGTRATLGIAVVRLEARLVPL